MDRTCATPDKFERGQGGAARGNVEVSTMNSNETTVTLDARGLEPPQPLIVILEALGNLREAGVMRAHTDRRPLHLYAQLDERGFIGESEEQHDGSFITTIRRA